MKTNKRLTGLSLLIFFLAFAVGKLQAQDNSYYAFIVVDGAWKNKVGYTSGIINYKGYANCKRYTGSEFFAEAKRKFSDHLQANYDKIFPLGENNNFQIIDMKKYSTSEMLLTYDQARQRLAEWIAGQKEQGFSVTQTSFSFSCDNLK
jgi:hypothetical protein